MIDLSSKQKLYTLYGGSFDFPLSVKQLLLVFLALSFAGTAAEICISHAQDRLIPYYEWIPVIYCVIAMALVIYYLLKPDSIKAKFSYTGIMLAGIVVGILGLYFHVKGNTVHSIYAWNWFIVGAPVLAPVVISWLSLFGLALMNTGPEVLLRLTALGFLLLAITSFLDHAATHFEILYTWIPVISGIFGFFICWLTARKIKEPPEEIPSASLFYGVILLMVIVGVGGGILHTLADFQFTVEFPWSRLFYYAPVLVPFLFTQMGILGFISSFRENS